MTLVYSEFQVSWGYKKKGGERKETKQARKRKGRRKGEKEGREEKKIGASLGYITRSCFQ